MTTADTFTRADIENYPFPLSRDQYRYSTNVEPAGRPVSTAAGGWGDRRVQIDRHYRHELDERARILARDPSRAQCLPHMAPAAWDAMLTLMRDLATDYPESMHLDRDLINDNTFRWRNDLLDIDDTFTFGDASTLPTGPLDYICGQIQEDVVLLDQREGQLWGDAGVVTFAADWSFGFDIGMSFLQIHGPVPRVHSEKIITRAHDFLLRLEPGQSYRRTNWTLTVDGKLDTATETYPEWGRDRRTLADGPLEDVGQRLFLRTEVQHLIRLPHSGAVMFLIRTYLLPLAAVATVDSWADRLYRVLEDLPLDMAEYKGLARTRGPALRWLSTFGGVTP
ncbi:heme-dependent oxidative N-demethylase family protein [Nocardia sp. A7]|uniref:heme-dependent oxidative N-demethylase family protein n=1 Tax=Nocardia sp. A7 TaxID=2789274 RepID=UPI003978E7C1